jgi:hypothetical protein
MRVHVTAQPLFDGTFSIDAVASTAHAVVAQLHDEAMATIATLAETWDEPVEEEDDDVRVLPVLELPPLVLRPRPAATNVTARLAADPASPADAVTDQFSAPVPERRQFVAL